MSPRRRSCGSRRGRSARPGSSPSLRQAITNAGLTPSIVGRVVLREPPLVRQVRVGRVAVDHHDRRAQEQRRDERVPHHPGGRREPLEAVAGPKVPAQAVVLQVLEQDPAVAVDDRLRERRSCPTRRARRAGGRTARARTRAAPRRPGARPTTQRRGARRRRRPHRGRGRRTPGSAGPSRIGGHLLAAVDELVAPAVAGDGEQQLRLELAEPVEHAADAELRRAGRPDRAEARGREEGDERLRDVRQVRDDPVAGADSEPLQAGARARDLLAELAERELDAARATASARRPRPRRCPRRGRACARRSSAARPGTTPRPACPREPSTRSYGACARISK